MAMIMDEQALGWRYWKNRVISIDVKEQKNKL
jgi:hypothetical protein